MIKIRAILSITLFLFMNLVATSQILQPVKWSFNTEKISESEVELLFIADIDAGWHVYSTEIPEGGPIPTSFNFVDDQRFELSGELSTPEPIVKFDKAFEMTLEYFGERAVFRQKVKLNTDEPFIIKGELEFMACDDSRCLPPDYVEFAFPMNGAGPQDAGVENQVDQGSETGTLAFEEAESSPDVYSEATGEDKSSDSLLAFFLIALGVGFVGLLTPCVYPMIPMTVSFFMSAGQSKAKGRMQALVFGFSIIFIYTVVGVLVSVIFGAEAIKSVSDHWLTNLIFFLLFATFAASFFGMFEIVLPSWLTNKSDKQADKGGFVGAFFMALTLVLVSFSCTAPFVGGILVEAATGEFLKPTVGMFGFSLAFAIVFTLLALFPGWLGKMPKSGGWLNSVKVVLAFLILAIGMKYLLVPNVALDWGISREVYIGVWIVLFTLLGFYLLGKIRFSHDSPVDHISVPRLLLVIIAFSFVFYLIPGLFGAPLKAVSGYLPTESSWDLDEIIRESTQNIAVVGSSTDNTTANLCDEPKYDDIFELPHGLKGYFDYDQALACARELNKPLFVDIKGHACTNCKVMEKNVWSDPEVLKRLREEFVIVALYVDDKTELPESEWITSTFDGKVKKTIGRKNTDFQITRFGVNAQPYYVIMGLNDDVLTDPVAFEPDVDDYLEFIDSGIEAFNQKY
jgi:thiol:disulfide interchange protein DsbD